MFKMMFKVFFKGFITTVLVIASLILCGTLGYFGSRTYFLDKAKRDHQKEVDKLIGKAQIDDVSRNLIYVYDKTKGKITGCVLEVLDTEANKLSYITIPTSGEITISRNLYKKIVQVNKEIPQVFRISQLCKYFSPGDDSAYGYGIILLEDYFGIDISYYTIVDSEDFAKAFENKKVQVKPDGTLVGAIYDSNVTTSDDTDSDSEEASEDDSDDGLDPYEHDDRFATNDSYADSTTADPTATTQVITDAYGNVLETTEEPRRDKTMVGVKKLKDSFVAEMSGYEDKDTLCEYFKSLYDNDNFKTNLDVKDKQSYADNYMELKPSSVQYFCIPGYYDGKFYSYDIENAKKLFKMCNVDLAKKEEAEDESTEETIPEVKKLVILNSTRTAGQAASWGEALEAYGYTITKVDNYDTQLADTKIIVAIDGQGEELLRYFNNASIEVGTVTDGADAVVIVGTNDIR